jgi:hypothetical protein
LHFGTILEGQPKIKNNLMKNRAIIVLALTIPILMVSCSPQVRPFTQEIREKTRLTEQELKSIQFYTSNTVVLRRGETSGAKETDKGELTVLTDAKVEEIIIKAGTPCLIKEVVDGNRVTVSFEDGAGKFLVFGSLRNRDGYYTLMALDWVNGKGKLNYGEKTYYSSPGSKDVFLTFKMKSLEKFRKDQKVVKGKTL